MADEEQDIHAHPAPAASRVMFDLENGETQTIYANTTHISVGASDVSILFGVELIGVSEQTIKPDVRVMLTHDNFIRMMEFWASRYQLLTSLYGGMPTSLDRLDPVKVQAAFAEMFSR